MPMFATRYILKYFVVVAGLLAATAVTGQSSSPPDLTGAWAPEPEYVFMMARPDGKPVPLQPWALEWAKKARAQFRAGKPPASNNQKCLPPGFLRNVQSVFPFMIVQTPEQVTFLYEENTRLQLIHMNQPAPADLRQSWSGYSYGRWEGDTLVVETVGARPYSWIVSMTDRSKTAQNNSVELPYTEAAKVTFRFRLIQDGRRLESIATIDDPKAYTKPWQVINVFRRLPPNERLREYVCAENNLDLRQ